MITIDKIKEYIKCPQFGDLDYGKWGALRLEQREAYKHLIDIVEGQEQEIEKLNNIIKEVREKLLCYGETFDSKIHQEMQKELLEILDYLESRREFNESVMNNARENN